MKYPILILIQICNLELQLRMQEAKGPPDPGLQNISTLPVSTVINAVWMCHILYCTTLEVKDREWEGGKLFCLYWLAVGGEVFLRDLKRETASLPPPPPTPPTSVPTPAAVKSCRGEGFIC